MPRLRDRGLRPDLSVEVTKVCSDLINLRRDMIKQIEASAERHGLERNEAVHRHEGAKFLFEMDGCIEGILNSGKLPPNPDELKAKWAIDLKNLLAAIEQTRK